VQVRRGGGRRRCIRPRPPVVLVVSSSLGPSSCSPSSSSSSSSSLSPYPRRCARGPRPRRPRILVVRCVVPIPPSSSRASSRPLPHGSRRIPVLVVLSRPCPPRRRRRIRHPRVRLRSPRLPTLSASLTLQSLVLVVIHIIPGPRGVLVSCRCRSAPRVWLWPWATSYLSC
jgi:hypothetical protein